jgi:hypothetical protein
MIPCDARERERYGERDAQRDGDSFAVVKEPKNIFMHAC